MRRESEEMYKVLRALMYKVRGALWWALIFLLVGFALGQQVPDTFLKHPVATLQLMKTLPLGSRVVAVGRQLEGQSSQPPWGEYGVVIGYETIKNLDNKTILLCRIRTYQGSGPLLAVNPRWVTRVDKRGAS